MRTERTNTRSYLSEVKDKLRDTIWTWTDDEGKRDELLAQVWQVVRSAVAQSYWNGVEHGASGRVKPKTSAAPRRRGQ